MSKDKPVLSQIKSISEMTPTMVNGEQAAIDKNSKRVYKVVKGQIGEQIVNLV